MSSEPPVAPSDAASALAEIAGFPEFAALVAAHRRLAGELAAGGAADAIADAERARLRADITVLFRQVDARLAALARLKEEVKALVPVWKQLPPERPATTVEPPPAPAPPRPPARATPVTAMRATAPVAEGASVRIDHLGASTFVAKGWTAISLGEWGRAEEALTRALALAPEDPEAGALLAWALMGQGRLDEAMLACQRVLARAPGYALARVNLGYVCLRKGIHGEAIEHLATVLREDDDRKATLYATFYLALVYLQREMYDDAVAFCRRALALGPNLIEAYYEMGRAHWLAGEREAACEAWRAGAASGKFNPWATRCAEVLDTVDGGGEPPGLAP